MYKGSPLLSVRRELRKKTTPWEAKLWYYLRANRLQGLKFKRQVQIGDYVVDFCCWSKRLIIELDGGHHTAQLEADKQRQDFLKSQGFTVLRFWNNEVDFTLDTVLEAIYNKCK